MSLQLETKKTTELSRYIYGYMSIDESHTQWVGYSYHSKSEFFHVMMGMDVKVVS